MSGEKEVTNGLNESLSYLKGISTASISDVLDMLGVNGGCGGILPVQPGASCLGPAYTVKFESVVPGAAAPAADYVDDVPSGSVIVLDNSGRVDCTVWGDILTIVAERRGLSGTVIHGCCRDAAAIRGMAHPVFSVSRFMKSGKNRVRMVARQVPVQIGGTLVRPGDFVRADDSGVICVPHELLARTVELVRELEEMEQKVRAEITSGSPLREARSKHGYNRFSLNPSAQRQRA